MTFIKELRIKRDALVCEWLHYVKHGTWDKFGKTDRLYNSWASIMVGRIREITDLLGDEKEFYQKHQYLGPINVEMPKA